MAITLPEQPETLAFIQRILNTFSAGDIFVDVGAYKGTFSLIAHRGKTVAFEPSTRAYNYLAQKIIDEGLTNVELHKKAVWEREIGYSINEKDFDATNTLNICYDHEEKTVTLNEFFSEEEWAKIKLIKVDVECSEEAVLFGARQIIHFHKPILVVEINDNGRYLKSLAKQHGYNISVIDNNYLLMPEGLS